MVFGLEGHKGCKVAANIIHGFDCIELVDIIQKHKTPKNCIVSKSKIMWVFKA